MVGLGAEGETEAVSVFGLRLGPEGILATGEFAHTAEDDFQRRLVVTRVVIMLHCCPLWGGDASIKRCSPLYYHKNYRVSSTL